MSENPFEIEDENEGNGAPVNSTIAEMRKAFDRKDKEVKSMAKEVEELRAFREQVMNEKREVAITSAFTEVGLPETYAKLFKAVNPSIDIESVNTETVAKFASEYQLPLASGAPAPVVEEQPQGYHPVVTNVPAPLAVLSQEEFQRLAMHNPQEAERALKEGRVQRARDTVDWYGDRTQS